jgi:hypothetical protein
LSMILTMIPGFQIPTPRTNIFTSFSAGLEDHTAICIACEGLMLRLNEDVFQPYFEEVTKSDNKDKASSS